MTVDEKTHNLITVTAQFEKAEEPAPGQQRQRPKMVPDTFEVLVYGKQREKSFSRSVSGKSVSTANKRVRMTVFETPLS
jgi:hypothetical protein